MWKRLLVPHDFSACAHRALEVARELATLHGASITLVHVSPLPPNLPADALVTPAGGDQPVRIDELTTGAARRQLEAIAAPMREAGLSVQSLALAAPSGDVVVEINAAVADLRADAIVVGTHGRTGLSHLLLGSVAEKIIRTASVPVITVRAPSPEAQPTREERVAEDELAG